VCLSGGSDFFTDAGGGRVVEVPNIYTYNNLPTTALSLLLMLGIESINGVCDMRLLLKKHCGHKVPIINPGSLLDALVSSLTEYNLLWDIFLHGCALCIKLVIVLFSDLQAVYLGLPKCHPSMRHKGIHLVLSLVGISQGHTMIQHTDYFRQMTPLLSGQTPLATEH
jgi:hypothetical protein